MRIRVSFHGGPLDGMESDTSSLPELKMFWPPRDRTVLVYRRFNEVSYGFDSGYSVKLSEIYDEAKEKFLPGREPSVETWVGEERDGLTDGSAEESDSPYGSD